MTIAIIYLILVVLVSLIGMTKGRGVDGFVLSLLLSPVVGLIWVLVMSDTTKIKCPMCKSMIDKNALICGHCRSEIKVK